MSNADMWSHLHTDRGGGRAARNRGCRGGWHNQSRGGGSAASSSGQHWVEATPKAKSLPLTNIARDVRYADDDELPDMDAQSSHAGCDQMSTLIN